MIDIVVNRIGGEPLFSTISHLLIKGKFYHVIILTDTLRLILHLRVAVLLPLIIAVLLSRGGLVVVQVMRLVNVIDQDASLLV